MKPVRFTVYCLIFSVIFLSGLHVKEVKSMCIRTMDISGGEDHTMVLTQNGLVFTCGLDQNPDYFYDGVLGIGTFTGSYKDTLFQVLEGQMETDSGYLENIAAIAAGWTHSLALDEDGFTWAWGGNKYGQLGLTE
jgi:alpha-tubulin suppressor-like RCC1 family protein